MINMGSVRRNVERMMRQFSSQQVTLLRPVRDAYGQPTHEREMVGTAECWTQAVNQPSNWAIRASGAQYDDEGSVWICLLWSDALPQARHEDICRFEDGTEYAVKNIWNRTDVRVYWQLGDRRTEEE